jgi:O-glycosyl hydrolase
MKRRILLYNLLIGLAALVACLVAVAIPTVSVVEIFVDETQFHQRIEGFGATHLSLIYEGIGDALSPELREQAIEAVFGQVGINTGNLEGALLESPDGWNDRANDNNDPFHTNWQGFQTTSADAIQQKLIKPASNFGFDHYYLSQKVNVRWASPWLNHLRQQDYDRYLDEIVEQVVAGHLYWRNTYGIEPTYQMLFNEPLSGNQELQHGSIHDLINIIKRTGARLQQEGFQVKFVLPNEETEEKTLNTAKAILADSEARSYVGAIGYHPYPYGSTYSSVPKILATSGAGQPDPNHIAVRQQLRDLGQQYGIPVWMTEVSHGEVDAQSFESFLGRAIHIHDELVYANAAAYFGMNNMWDSTSQQMHFGNQNLASEEGTIVHIDIPQQTVSITGMGYAIGHYARWIKRGAVRLEATSRDPLIQVTAFEDENLNQLILVAINNADEQKRLNVHVNGLKLENTLMGEQSTETAYWQPTSLMEIKAIDRFVLDVPAKSVTTIVSEELKS